MIKKSVIWSLLASSLPGGTVYCDSGPVATESASVPHVRLCDALESVQLGDRLRISVTGAYYDGLLYDPFEPVCAQDVQPLTIVEWSPELAATGELPKLSGTAVATFTGVLWGAPRLQPDDPGLPTSLAYANRFGDPVGYGPRQRMRTKLVVEKVENLRPAASFPEPPAQTFTTRSPLPIVTSAAMSNLYPGRARQAHVSGDVLIEVTVRKGKVLAKALSGDRLLVDDALAGVKSWAFDPEIDGIFTTTFSYRFEDLPPTAPSVRLRMDLPFRVEIIAPRDAW